ncbi:MAG: response regulator [Magnetococcales bacterium]|nr:response regulator [Magnetococcales bacterium]
MTIDPLIRRSCPTVDALTGIHDVEDLLLEQGFLVVTRVGRYLGLLVADDILERGHTLVVDCLRPKPTIGLHEEIQRVFTLMKTHRLPVLAVLERDDFLGVVTQTAILEHLAKRGETFERRIAAHAHELSMLNQSLQTQIAEHKRAEARATAANLAKSRFLANFSHEIRTPLHIILGLSQILTEPLEDLSRERLTDRLNRIHAAGHHLLGLVEEMLDLARIEAGHCQTRPVPMDPGHLLRDVVAWFQEEAFKRGNRVEALVDETIETVLADPLRLRQILLNLLANANRFTENGEITARLQRLESESGPCRLRFSVEDTGIGISAEVMQTLFDPFILGEHPSTENACGAGLGLAICKTLVEVMGGSLQVESHPLEGSCFEFTLSCPIALPAHRATETVAALLPPQRALSILLFEEDFLSLALLTKFLTGDGHRVIIPRAGQDPLTTIQEEKADLLLTDLRLLDRDGIEIIRAVRALPDTRLAGLPILALTADAVPERLQAALQAGANALLTKPVDLNHLRRALSAPDHPTLENHDSARPRAADPIRPLPILNTAILQQGALSLGNARFREICQKFHAVEAETLQEMTLACANRDHESLSHVAHRISGSAAHLGMEALSRLAERLADEARNTLPEPCAPRIQEFAHAARAARMALDQWMLDMRDAETTATRRQTWKKEPTF